jgi:hypothetical protein
MPDKAADWTAPMKNNLFSLMLMFSSNQTPRSSAQPRLAALILMVTSCWLVLVVMYWVPK